MDAEATETLNADEEPLHFGYTRFELELEVRLPVSCFPETYLAYPWPVCSVSCQSFLPESPRISKTPSGSKLYTLS